MVDVKELMDEIYELLREGQQHTKNYSLGRDSNGYYDDVIYVQGEHSIATIRMRCPFHGININEVELPNKLEIGIPKNAKYIIISGKSGNWFEMTIYAGEINNIRKQGLRMEMWFYAKGDVGVQLTFEVNNYITEEEFKQNIKKYFS